MRTTLTLDEDVAAKLQSLARRSGRPFREVVNETLRHGLARRPQHGSGRPFRVVTRDLGARLAGVGFDSVADLLEHVEGPVHR